MHIPLKFFAESWILTPLPHPLARRASGMQQSLDAAQQFSPNHS